MPSNKSFSPSSDLTDLFPLYVVILNWNAAQETLSCLKSLAPALTYLGGETHVIVIDNGSADASVNQLTQEMPALFDILLPLPQNLGFAGGVNVGIQFARQRGAGSVLLLNNDTVVAENSIFHLAVALVVDRRAAISGPLIYYAADPTRFWRIAARESRWLPIPIEVTGRDRAVQQDTPFSVDYVTACCMLLRSNVIDQVGLFDERFFMYSEDSDYCRRARNLGFSIYCVPRAKIWHKVSLSANRDKPAMRYMTNWARVQFHRKHPHGMLSGLVHPYILIRAALVTLRDIHHRDWHLISPLWRGIWDGYRATV